MLELILCDGGSKDGTVAEAERLAAAAPFPVRLCKTATGRARQMNAGRRLTDAPLLLFLHADCRFIDKDALQRGVDMLLSDQTVRTAGRYALRFDQEGPVFHFHELKARQNREGCINGDQGWLIPAPFFDSVGPFDESLPFFEDARLAPIIARNGRWILIDRQIVTSSRRFEQEGQQERRLLNALVMACGHTGLDGLLAHMPAIYRQQRETRRLSLAPFFQSYRQAVAALSPPERRQHRRLLGEYLAANLWQLPLMLDSRREFRRGLPAGSEGASSTARWSPLLDRLGRMGMMRAFLALLWRILAASRS